MFKGKRTHQFCDIVSESEDSFVVRYADGVEETVPFTAVTFGAMK